MTFSMRLSPMKRIAGYRVNSLISDGKAEASICWFLSLPPMDFCNTPEHNSIRAITVI